MLTNAEIKHLKSLQLKKFRDEHNVFIAEGPKAVDELIKSDFKIERLLGLESWITSNQAKLAALAISAETITEKELNRISGMKSPSSVLATVQIPTLEPDIQMLNQDLNLMLSDIRDPGNFGTIIRTADWFGVGQILCSRECVELYNPKVIQATMGSFTRVKVVYTDLHTILSQLKDIPVYAAVMDGENMYKQKLESKGVIIIGNESHGISPGLNKNITHKITIPSVGKTAESLNVAVATAVICGEFRRQGN